MDEKKKKKRNHTRALLVKKLHRSQEVIVFRQDRFLRSDECTDLQGIKKEEKKRLYVYKTRNDNDFKRR